MTQTREATDRIKNESSISRQLQQRVPHPDLHTYENSAVGQLDTADEEISQTLVEESSVVNVLTWDSGSVLVTPNSAKITELKPTTHLTQYNKCHVKEDKEGHLFYFDYSEGNIRTHLRHPKGTYFTIDHDGNYNFKVIKDHISIVKYNKKTAIGYDNIILVKHDNKLNVKNDNYLTVNGRHCVSIGESFLTRVGGSRYDDIDTDHEKNVDGNQVYRVRGYWNNTIDDTFSIRAKQGLFLNTQGVLTIDGGRVFIRAKASYKEQVEGKREISCDLLSLTGADKIAMSTTGPMQIMAGGVEEVITGFTLPPSVDAKTTKIMVGNYVLETKLGNITLESLGMGISLICTLKNAQITIDNLGAIEASNTLGSLTISATGEGELINNMGSVKTLNSKVEIDHLAEILIGTASPEVAVMGKKLIQWLAAHTHGTGVGPSSPPIQASTCTEIMLCSQRVKIGV